jgi:hypothetical protein
MKIEIEQIEEGPDVGKWRLLETDTRDGIPDVIDDAPHDTKEEAEKARKRYIKENLELDALERSEARGLAAMEGRLEDYNDLSGDA